MLFYKNANFMIHLIIKKDPETGVKFFSMSSYFTFTRL